MTKEQKAVRDWMVKFGQDCPDKPTQIDDKTAILRGKLTFEESLELIIKGLGLEILIHDGVEDIIINKSNINKIVVNFKKSYGIDFVELADGVSDCLVVNEGALCACGIDSEEIHQEVFSSNDSKMWKEDELYLAKDYFVKKVSDGERGYLVKNEAGKVVKSPSYSPAQIGKIIEKQSK